MHVNTLLRCAFWSALAGTLYLALVPETLVPMTYDKVAIAVTSATPSMLNSDKSQHAAAFFILMTIGAAAYRGFGTYRMAITLFALGGAIELLQAMPLFSRDCQMSDWVADSVAILAGLGVILVQRRLPPIAGVSPFLRRNAA